MILIAATNKKGVIGVEGHMPWVVKEDMAFFKATTTGNIVILGGKTWVSLNHNPLPNRVNVVLSRTLVSDKAYIFSEIEQLINFVNNIKQDRKVYVIGGSEIYKLFLERGLIQEALISVVNKNIRVGNKTYLPEIPLKLLETKKFNTFKLKRYGIQKR